MNVSIKFIFDHIKKRNKSHSFQTFDNSHVLHNDVWVNNGQNKPWWSPKIIMELKTSYHLVTSQPSKHRSTMYDSHVCGDAGLNKPTVLPVIKVYST